MSNRFVSLLETLQEAINFLLESERVLCHDTVNGLVEIVTLLSQYREEGKALYPKIFIFDDLETVLGILAEHENIKIGNGPKNNKLTFKKALKECAPLAIGGWAIYIYIRRKDDFIDYGLFKSIGDLLKPSIESTLLSNDDDSPTVIMAYQVSEKYVKVVGRSGNSLLVNFGTAGVDEEPPTVIINRFIDLLTSDIEENEKLNVHYYYELLFEDILRKGHGTLAVVISHENEIPDNFRDSIKLDTSIKVLERISTFKTQRDVDTNKRLESSVELTKGMLLSDGITIFNTKGDVIAYKAFVKRSIETEDGKVHGGARSRAFNVLCKMVEDGLIVSTFMQSQDGAVYHKGV
ncbi:MAG: hypothetical protein L3V56_02580 [Candidatus Magnetoovum sp. WYHC-5]|nr:hypothetical protein [Candidatus Magnetoovum sp. WYHC-5]